jgi:hypothetical protein
MASVHEHARWNAVRRAPSNCVELSGSPSLREGASLPPSKSSRPQSGHTVVPHALDAGGGNAAPEPLDAVPCRAAPCRPMLRPLNDVQNGRLCSVAGAGWSRRAGHGPPSQVGHEVTRDSLKKSRQSDMPCPPHREPSLAPHPRARGRRRIASLACSQLLLTGRENSPKGEDGWERGGDPLGERETEVEATLQFMQKWWKRCWTRWEATIDAIADDARSAPTNKPMSKFKMLPFPHARTAQIPLRRQASRPHGMRAPSRDHCQPLRAETLP